MSASQSKSVSSILEKIPKLQDCEGYLRWQRTVRDTLKLFKLWTFIAIQKSAPVDPDGLETWTVGQDEACTALRLVVEGNAYTDIEDHTNASEAWYLLEANFKPRGSGFLNGAMEKLFFLTLSECKDAADYVTKFRSTVTELKSFSTKFQMDENLLIFLFQYNLSATHSAYCQSYAQEHDPFGLDGSAKYSLSYAMHHFQNTVANPSKIAERSLVSLASLGPSALVSSQDSSTQQSSIQAGAQVGTNNARVISLRKTVKYCTHCKKDYHSVNECHVKYPNLAPSPNSTKPATKRRRGGGGGPNKKTEEVREEDQMAHFAENELISFVSSNSVTPLCAPNTWVWDCGCSQHSTPDRSIFLEYRTLGKNQKAIRGLTGSVIPTGIGTVELVCDTPTGAQPLTLYNVLHTPGTIAHLISQGQMHREGYTLTIVSGGIEIGANGVIAKFMSSNLYLITTLPRTTMSFSAFTALNPHTVDMWHSRLGHLGKQNIVKLAGMSEGIDLSQPPPSDACAPCARGTLQVETHIDAPLPGQGRLDLVHSDVIRPFPPASNGTRYVVTFLDDDTKESEVCFLKRKSEVFQAFQSYLARNERGGLRNHRLRTDGGGEYDSNEWTVFREEKGIVWEPIIPGNPQQNGSAERLGQTLLRKASAMLKESNLDIKYWPEMIRTANYLRNRQPVTGKSMTPFEASYGRRPQLGHLRRIGQIGYAQDRKPSTGWKKFQDRAIKCRLLGYEGNHIYRMLMPGGSIMRYSNVAWTENLPIPSPEPISKEIPVCSKRPKYTALDSPSSGDPGATNIQDLSSDECLPDFLVHKNRGSHLVRPLVAPIVPLPTPFITAPSTPLIPPKTPILTPPIIASSSSTTSSLTPVPSTIPNRPVTRLQSRLHHIPLNAPSTFLAQRTSPITTTPLPTESNILCLLASANSTEPYEPLTYADAVRDTSPYHLQWQAAMQEEFDSLIENQTWRLLATPADRISLGGKWVFRLKRGPGGEITRFKARWVVKGFQQQEGIDYNQTFASVVKPMSYKSIFAIAAARDWEIEQMDVRTAFLYGDIEEEIYVQQPTGFIDAILPNYSCLLKKALYGTRQGPRIWYRTLAEFLTSCGFRPINADLSVFAKKGIILAIYVDDLLLVGASRSDIQNIKDSLKKRFRMVDLGSASYYLGMTVTRDRTNHILRLGQVGYLEQVLRTHGMWDSKPVATPMDSSLVAAATDHQCANEFRLQYQSAVGSLMYAMLGTRPDIAFAVSVVSRHASNPDSLHWQAVKRILRYLKGSLKLQLTFRGPLQVLSGYSDADWAGDHDTRRSTSGFVFNIGSGAISWSAKRQPTVALSSCEAEYMGQTQATKEAIWLKSLLAQLDSSLAKGVHAVIIHCDNQGAIALAKNPESHARSKHIDIQWHYQRERIEDGSVEFRYIPTEEQIADGLTKALTREKFLIFRRALGLE